ncbi:MAG TPA: M48 family metalloprotease [Rickettsiales bacterium]|nr:M48 family metalloprotease [Rickettsiales bacterium]
MFAKPFNLILVYIVTIFNIAILASPLLALLIPLLTRHGKTFEISNDLAQKFKLAIYLVIFLVSFFMLFYLLLDMLFGFAMRASMKNCTVYEKMRDYEFLTKIFEQVKEKFDEKSVKLYIKDSDEINAFAVASFGGRAIVLTSGLIDHYLKYSEDSKEFLYALRSIMGHEMSHLINKDFLPTYLIIANQKATNFTANLLNIIFNFASRITAMLPYGGNLTSRLMIRTYILLNFFFSFFNRFIVYNVYEFLRKFVSRSLEYRCDRQSAKAFGGQNMALALSFLGESGYFTLFSTHPGTKRRINKVKDIEIDDRIVRPNFIESITNYFAVMFLIIICLFFAKQAGIDLLVREYIKNHEVIQAKLNMLWQLVSQFF